MKLKKTISVKKAIICCGICGAITAGAGVGIGYGVWHEKTTDTINPIPVNSNFFDLTNGIINGYANAFVDSWVNYDTLWNYMYEHGARNSTVLDLSGATISGNKYALAKARSTFTGYEKYSNINTFYRTLTKIDLSNATFAWGQDVDKINRTGNCTFGVGLDGDDALACDFHNVTKINFTNTNFAPNMITPLSGDVITATWTFSSADLSNLIDLNLANVTFATTDMTSGGNIHLANSMFRKTNLSGLTNLDLAGAKFVTSNMSASESGNVYVANFTFAYSKLSKLNVLNLAGAVFATSNMVSSRDVYSANATFAYADFSSLTDLDLTGATFVATNMTSGNVITANDTFAYADFSSLSSLNLTGVIFATANMTISNGGATAHRTFYSITTFLNLTNLNLTGAVFAVDNMTSGSGLITASETFALDKFSIMTDLYLPSNQDNQTWTKTFNDAEYNNSVPGVVHFSGADSPTPGAGRPINWTTTTDKWFNDWNWQVT